MKETNCSTKQYSLSSSSFLTFSKVKRFSIILLAASLSIVPNAWADGDTTDYRDSDQQYREYTEYMKRSMDQVVKPFKKSDSKSLEYAGSEYFFGDSAEALPPRIHDPFASIIEGGEDGSSGNYKELSADTIRHNTFMLPTFSGRTQLMQGDAIMSAYEMDMQGTTAQLATAIAGVEPGIAQGWQLANIMVDSVLSNSYRAYNTFVNQPFENDEVKKKVLTIFNQCVYKKITDGMESQSDSTPWIEAVSKCMGDTGVEDISVKLNADQTKATKPELEDKLHPVHSENNSKAVVKDKISVAAELFNYGDGNDNNARNSRRDLYQSWLTMFGDYQIRINDNYSGSGISPKNAYEIEETRIPPEKRLSQLEQDLLADRFNDFMKLSAEYCDYMANLQSQPGREPSYWYSENGLKQNQQAQRYVFRLTTPEKSLSGAAIQIPVNLVFSSETGSNTAERWRNASQFFRDHTNIESIIQNNSGGAMAGGGNGDKVTGAHYKAVLFAQGYARHVAISQLIRSIYEAVNFVGSRTAGTGHVGNNIVDKALRLIDDVVKVDNLDQMYLENAVSWDEFITSNFFTADIKNTKGFNRVQTSQSGSGGTTR